jgi:hypothetical protein
LIGASWLAALLAALALAPAAEEEDDPKAARALPAAPPPARARHGAFVHLGVMPRLVSVAECASDGCAAPRDGVGYAASGALGVGWAFGRLALALEATLGATAIDGRSEAVWDQLVVARWFALSGLYLEIGAGVGAGAGRFGLVAREGLGFELAVGRSVAFAPSLSVTEQLDATRFGRVSADAQAALRYYF